MGKDAKGHGSNKSTTKTTTVAGVKTMITTLPNGKKQYKTILPRAKNAGAPGTPYRK